MTQHQLADALRTLRDYGCPVCSGDCAGANPPVLSCPMKEADAALSQYEKSDTDRDQLREAVQEAEIVFRQYERLHLTKATQDGDEKAYRNKQLADKMAAALASKTAIDPVTVERCAQVAETLPTDWRDGTQPGPSSAYRHAVREIAAAIRALGKDQA